MDITAELLRLNTKRASDSLKRAKNSLKLARSPPERASNNLLKAFFILLIVSRNQ